MGHVTSRSGKRTIIVLTVRRICCISEKKKYCNVGSLFQFVDVYTGNGGHKVYRQAWR